MKTTENFCVQCPSELGCLGASACPYMNVEVHYCDKCGDYAKYTIDDERDYCEKCAEKYLNELWDECTIDEKAALLGIIFEERS